jgi:hypothetical protein
MPLLGRKRLVLHSPLSVETCVAKLKSALNSSSSAVVGYVAGSVRLRRRIGYYNSFQTRLSATLHAGSDGTRINARLGVRGLVTVFFVLALAFIVLLGGLHIFGALRSQPFERVLPQILGIGTMFLAAFSVPFFGLYLSRGDARVLDDFLRQTLDAGEDI